MEFLENLAMVLLPYAKTLSLVSGILGEDLLLFLAVLAGNDVLPLWVVWVFGFIGAMIHDIAVYGLARSHWAYRLKKHWRLTERTMGIVRFIERMGGKTMFLPLMISKFVYGTRIAFVVYLSHREHRFWRYFFMNALAVFTWSAIMLPFGWLAGRGFSQLLHIAKGIEKLLLMIALGVLVIFIIRKVFSSGMKRSERRMASPGKYA